MKILILVSLGVCLMSNVMTKNSINAPSKSFSIVADTLKIDAETGLISDPNLLMVKAQCISCHSSKLIIQNRFTRDGWKQKIRWMQAKHNLWDLGETEKQVLDYLEKNYSPTVGIARRAPLKNIKWYKLDQK
ncbi:hypothetical protein FHS68_005075 [Dyadobacter arcticus]|uniref:Monoheme cytochrome C n=2 Tax=Dyadobacter arcticus TaxID=1078754 RepID=A0ABX0USF3_9BACT|nr:hypothetical protein [Dyadobacter arcticus]NIJ55882.1 hypothetical protein [Dyadobacter arcticus]